MATLGYLLQNYVNADMKISEFETKAAHLRDPKMSMEMAIELLAEFITPRSARENIDSHFSFEDTSFREYVDVAKSFADEWCIPFDPRLFVVTLLTIEGNTPQWNSSTGICGHINPGEVGEW